MRNHPAPVRLLCVAGGRLGGPPSADMRIEEASLAGAFVKLYGEHEDGRAHAGGDA